MKRRTVVTAALVGGAFAVLAFAERRRPLRKRVEPDFPRVARNAAMGALALAVTELMQTALIEPATRRTRRFGLLNHLRLPKPLHLAVSVILLDYTLWWWHWMNHRLPLFWRFHLVHHL